MSDVQLQSNESMRPKEEISKKKKKEKVNAKKEPRKLSMSRENKGYVNNAILFDNKSLHLCREESQWSCRGKWSTTLCFQRSICPRSLMI